MNDPSNSARADEVVRTMRDIGGTAVAVQADIGDEAAVTALFETVDRKLGRIDALVNNAGILTPVGRVESVDAAALARLVQTNIVGTVLCCREAIRRMSTSHGGSPGLVETEMVPASRIEEVAPTMPMKRLCRVDEVAEAIVWLLSNKASGWCCDSIRSNSALEDQVEDAPHDEQADDEDDDDDPEQ